MSRKRPYALLDHVDRATSFVFVPAIMSVGLVFSIASVARDAVRRRGLEALARRGAIGGHTVARAVLAGEHAPMAQLRPRRFYAVATVVMATLAIYIAVGSIANYFRTGDYVAFLAWMLTISLLIPAALLVAAGVTAATWRSWPRPPPWARPLLAATPLTAPVAAHARVSLRPRTVLGITIVTALAAAFVALSVTLAARPDAFGSFDERWLAELSAFWGTGGGEWVGRILGSTHVSVILAGLIGLATVRCKPFALFYMGAIFGGLGLSALAKYLVGRPRPELGIVTEHSFPSDLWVGVLDSFPSGHIVQLTLIAGLLPLAAWVLTGHRPAAFVAAPLLYGVLLVSALDRIGSEAHWPTDVIGGLLLGGFIVAVARFALRNRLLHVRCTNCPWVGDVE